MSRSRLFDGVHFFICPPVTHVAGVRKYEAAQLVSAADLAAEIVAHGGGLLTTLTAAGAVAPRADGLPAVFAVGNPSQCYHASDEFRRVAQSPKLPPGAAPRSPSLLVGGTASSVTFIRPAFIKDSIAAQALLSHAPYLVFNPSPSPSFAAAAAASTVAAADQSPKSPGGASSYRAADSGPSLENSLRLPAGTHLMLDDADHKVVDDDDNATDVSDIEHDIASEMHQLAELIDMSSDHIQRVAELEEKLNAIIATGVAVLGARPRKSASASNTSF